MRYSAPVGSLIRLASTWAGVWPKPTGTAGSPASASRFFPFSKSCTVPVRPKPHGPDDIPAIADRMAGLIWQVLADERSPLADRLLQTPPLKTWR